MLAETKRLNGLQGSGDMDARVAGSRRASAYGDMDPEVAYNGTTKTSSLPGLIGNALGLRIPHVGGPAYQAASGGKTGPHTFKWVRGTALLSSTATAAFSAGAVAMLEPR